MCFAKWALGVICGWGMLFLTGCGGTSGPANSVNATMQQAQLSVSLTGSGGGTISSSPPGISCGQTCTASFNSGTTVTLTATPNSGNTFLGWSGACTGTGPCQVSLSGASTVSATFTQLVPLTVSEQGSGTVTSSPPGINCPQTCSAGFTSGTTVTLAAVGNNGNNFDGWSSPCSGTNTCTVTLNSPTSVEASFRGGSLQSINHIIYMLQENRSFDHYFGHLPEYLAAKGYPQTVDGEPDNASNPSADGTSTVNAFHLLTQCVESIKPAWNYSHPEYNRKHPTSATATLDGFVYATALGNVVGYHDIGGTRTMGYYDSSDLPYYYFMAANFATSDRWFSPVMTNTQPNRMYLMAATSVGNVHPLPPGSPRPPGPTIFDLLQKAGISWRVYVTDNVTPLATGSALNMFAIADKYPQNFVPASQFESDAANGTLPQVGMIDPGYESGLDEHPQVKVDQLGGGIQKGSHYVSTLINALMQSPSWQDSVFILSFDEGGGFYDHVPPQPAVSPDGIPPILQSGEYCYGTTTPLTCDFTVTGYRIPLLVISPFTKKNYVSHTVADNTAILKLIETRFNLPSLTKRDAAQMDMTEFFDFVNTLWATPPTPPLQPTNSDSCYLDHLP